MQRRRQLRYVLQGPESWGRLPRRFPRGARRGCRARAASPKLVFPVPGVASAKKSGGHCGFSRASAASRCHGRRPIVRLATAAVGGVEARPCQGGVAPIPARLPLPGPAACDMGISGKAFRSADITPPQHPGDGPAPGFRGTNDTETPPFPVTKDEVSAAPARRPINVRSQTEQVARGPSGVPGAHPAPGTALVRTTSPVPHGPGSFLPPSPADSYLPTCGA